MALDGIQGIYPRCLSVPREFPCIRLKPCVNEGGAVGCLAGVVVAEKHFRSPEGRG